MVKLSKKLLFVFLFVFSLPHSIFSQNPKQIHLHYYIHEIVLGANISSVVVTKSSNHPYTTRFGEVTIIDSKVTETPEFSSNEIGRAQGIYTHTSQTQFSLLMSYTLVFTNEEYNRSILVVLGRNPYVKQPLKEMLIDRGIGKFWLARGYALMSSASSNAKICFIDLLNNIKS
ncbi:hypothetical protein ACFE04_018272 [Oxalis oulophora]